jgi:hypothetical protein
MEGGPKASRRAILRHGVLAMGALAGVVGLGSAAERVRSGNLLAQTAPGKPTLTLRGTDWHLLASGLKRGDLPKRGDQVSVSGTLSIAPATDAVGSFFASVQHLDSRVGHGSYATVQQETHTFQLPEGTLFGIGTTVPGADGAFAIVGGTGRYLGASGSYVAQQNPFETGGDGTAVFTITLNSGR